MLLAQPMPTGRGQGQLWVLGHHRGQGPWQAAALGQQEWPMQAQRAGGMLRCQAAAQTEQASPRGKVRQENTFSVTYFNKQKMGKS